MKDKDAIDAILRIINNQGKKDTSEVLDMMAIREIVDKVREYRDNA